jgi:hypothetical protein
MFVQPPLPLCFDGEFALAPSFLAEDAAPAPPAVKPPGEAEIVGPGDGITFPDDPFGLLGDKW